MEAATTVFEKFALPVAIIIVMIVAIIVLFKYIREQNDKHDTLVKEQADKYDKELRDQNDRYFESYKMITESNHKVTDALNNNTKTIESNTRLIEKLVDKLDVHCSSGGSNQS